MPATKGSAPFTWASGGPTASGTTNPLDCSTYYSQQVAWSIAQVGTATTPASFLVQYQPKGSVNWYLAAPIAVPATAGVSTDVVDVPAGAGAVRVAYTAQAGGTSSTATFELQFVSGV